MIRDFIGAVVVFSVQPLGCDTFKGPVQRGRGKGETSRPNPQLRARTPLNVSSTERVTPGRRFTALHEAARNNHVEVVRQLLEASADVCPPPHSTLDSRVISKKKKIPPTPQLHPGEEGTTSEGLKTFVWKGRNPALTVLFVPSSLEEQARCGGTPALRGIR